MKILLFDADPPGGVSLRAALLALGHEVETTTTADALAGDWDVVCVWVDPGAPPPVALLQRLRAALPAQVPMRLASPLGALVEEMLPWPADPGALAARLAQLPVSPFRGRFAHDFNNHLTAIQGHAELALLSPHLEGSVRHSLSQIHDSAVRAVDLIRQLRSPAAARPAAAAGTILLIDPDDATRRAAHRDLRRAGYVVFEVASAAEGLDLMAQIAPALDAIVVDPLPATLPEILRLRPGVRLVFWSDATEGALRPLLPAGAVFAYAPKPQTGALVAAMATMSAA